VTIPPEPIRLLAVADSSLSYYGRFVVREFLDVTNEDQRRYLIVKKVTADTWIGRKVKAKGEEWKDLLFPMEIPPGITRRVAERQRTIQGPPRRNWWVRWVKFSVETNWGTFRSNFIASPLKPPAKVLQIRPQNQIDDLSAPPAYYDPK